MMSFIRTALLPMLLAACHGAGQAGPPVLHWYVFNESSGAFAAAAEHCTKMANEKYRIMLTPLPADADQQREQLVRRLAAGDQDIDIIGMDVIWTAEFAQAGWILPWEGGAAARARQGRLPSTLASAT